MSVYKRGDIYYIDFYVNGKRVREKIGPNQKLAKQVLAKRQTEVAEGKFLEKKKEVTMRLDKLIDEYLEHTKELKKSHRRDKNSADHFFAFYGKRAISVVTPASLEKYRAERKKHRTRDNKPPAPATINREISFLKRVFSWAVENNMLSDNPVKRIKMLKEDNIRDRVLSEDEWKRLKAVSHEHLLPILIVAYFTGMRKGEILGLRWGQVDFDKGFITLDAEETKTNQSRQVPMHQDVMKMLKAIKKPDMKKTDNVFKFQGNPILDVKNSFGKACKAAGIENFRFHDFRHTAITNWRRQGHDYFKIMKASGHKTMSTFKRYNTVSEEDLRSLVDTPEVPNVPVEERTDEGK